MRLSISGAGNLGKSTLVRDFLLHWPNYSKPDKSYRNIMVDKVTHSKKTTKEVQWNILSFMLEEMQKYNKTDNIIFDRCPMDNLIYSLWAFDKGIGDIDKEFIDKCIPLIANSYKFLDIIFFIPITKAAPVKIEADGIRETDELYIKEIDALFKTMIMQYSHNLGRTPFFPADDSPAIIEIFGNPIERIEMLKLYLDPKGEPIGGDVNSSNNLFNPQNILEMEALLQGQKADHEREETLKIEQKKIKDFVKKNGSKFF